MSHPIAVRLSEATSAQYNRWAGCSTHVAYVPDEQWTPTHEVKLNEIDKRITAGMLEAKKQTYKKRRLP
jgi:hypothetical protein